MSETPAFEFDVATDADLGSRLVVGFANPGMAGLIAADHLVSEFDTEQVGHARVRNLPTVTPFTDGTPRRPTRLYRTDSEVALLVSEVVTSVAVADRFAGAIGDLAERHGFGEITVLNGVGYPHGPDQHAVFSVATDAYPTGRLAADGVSPLAGGFLDGLPAGLLTRGLDADGPAVGVLLTPAHPPGPEFEGALRLLGAVSTLLETEIDTTEIAERSEEINRYYRELADRVESASTEGPEDRMYM